MNAHAPAKVVVLGGGFGGLYAAIRLQKLLSPSRCRLTLVNRDNYFLFTPMLHEVAASDLDVTHIVNPVRKLIRRGHVFVGTVEDIDLEKRRVSVAHASGTHRHELEYDHLVLALGCVTNFFGLRELERRAFTMKSLGDALALRNRLIQLLEEADFECAIEQRHALLTVMVAGAGFAGVETVAAVNDFLREAIQFYPHLQEEMLRIVLVDAGSVILPELHPKLGEYAQRKLAARGVDIRVATQVTGVSERGVELSDGSAIDAETVVWTAGTTPHPLVADLPCATERGRVPVNEYLEVPGWPGVWAVGDCALVPDGDTGRYHPPTAQHALREGKVVADNIAASIAGGRKRAFTFTTLGQLAAIGRRTGVANIFGINFSGFIAWWLWRTIYLSKLPRFERKIRVALDWSLDLVFSKDLVVVEPPRGPARSLFGQEPETREQAVPPAPTPAAPEPARIGV